MAEPLSDQPLSRRLGLSFVLTGTTLLFTGGLIATGVTIQDGFHGWGAFAGSIGVRVFAVGVGLLVGAIVLFAVSEAMARRPVR